MDSTKESPIPPEVPVRYRTAGRCSRRPPAVQFKLRPAKGKKRRKRRRLVGVGPLRGKPCPRSGTKGTATSSQPKPLKMWLLWLWIYGAMASSVEAALPWCLCGTYGAAQRELRWVTAPPGVCNGGFHPGPLEFHQVYTSGGGVSPQSTGIPPGFASAHPSAGPRHPRRKRNCGPGPR